MRPASKNSLEQAIESTSRALVSVHLSHRSPSDGSYLCPDCSAAVIPVRGSVYRWHFRHYQTRECCHSASETPLHKRGKAIIAEAREITVPADRLTTQERRLSIDRCELEKRVGRVQYDALLHTDVGPVAVEIYVTHRVDEHKAEKLAVIKIPCVEITLSPTDDSATSSDWVLHDAPREWVHEPSTRVDASDQKEQPNRYGTHGFATNDGVSIQWLIDGWHDVKAHCTDWLDRTVVSRGGTPIACPSMDNFDRACLEFLCTSEIEGLQGLVDIGKQRLNGIHAMSARAELRRAQHKRKRLFPADLVLESESKDRVLATAADS